MESTRSVPSFRRSGSRSRKAMRISTEELVRSRPLFADRGLPLLIEPVGDGVNLVDWAAANREWIDHKLFEVGGLLFRGFNVDRPERFEAFVGATSSGPLEYKERSSPRHAVEGNVYTSTDHPSDQEIYLHNEQSYNLRFPLKIYFCCLTAAEEGGATPIADSRKVLARLPEDVRRPFEEKGYLYMRNFGEGLGLPWQVAFQTDDRSRVEEYCRANAIRCEWKSDNRLRTRQVRPVLARHPHTGELTWFNHATFFNVTTLAPELQRQLREQFAEEDLPNQTFYGDGTPIPDEVLEDLQAAYAAERVVFPWEEGDVLMLDNTLVAHGREPFKGHRKVVVGMADPFAWTDVDATEVMTKEGVA